MGNWGVHYCDAIRWMLDEEAPVSISACGSKSMIDDDRTIPDTLEVTFEFASGRLVVFGQYEACNSGALPGGEIEFCGTLGNLYPAPEARGCKITPAGKRPVSGFFQESGSKRNCSHGWRSDSPAYPEFFGLC
jgi:predicted dehydrogenase